MADVRKPIRVLGVLAGADMPPEQLRRWVDSADVVLAADSGADTLQSLNVIPKVTLGDLDSISEAASRVQTTLIRNEDQNTTDCDKLLAHAYQEGYESITLAGVEGDLLDHVLGTVYSAAKARLAVRFALRRGLGMILNGPVDQTLKTLPQTRLSVIPLEPCEGVTLKGTRWPLSNANLEPFGFTSLSNIAESDEVELKIKSGRAFVFVETDGCPVWSDE